MEGRPLKRRRTGGAAAPLLPPPPPHVDTLPDEIMLHVLLFVPCADHSAVLATCKWWRRLGDEAFDRSITRLRALWAAIRRKHLVCALALLKDERMEVSERSNLVLRFALGQRMILFVGKLICHPRFHIDDFHEDYGYGDGHSPHENMWTTIVRLHTAGQSTMCRLLMHPRVHRDKRQLNQAMAVACELCDKRMVCLLLRPGRASPTYWSTLAAAVSNCDIEPGREILFDILVHDDRVDTDADHVIEAARRISSGMQHAFDKETRRLLRRELDNLATSVRAGWHGCGVAW